MSNIYGIEKKAAIFFRANKYNDEIYLSTKTNLKKFVKQKKNWELIGIYSSCNEENYEKNRKNFSKLIDDIFNKNIDLFVIDSISSLNIEELDLNSLLTFLRDNNVDIYFVKEKYSTRKKTVSNQLNVIKDFSKNYSKNIVNALSEKSLNGYLPYGTSFFGYIYDVEKKNYIINEEQAKVVRLIFKLYLDGMATRKIATKLEKDGYLNYNNQAKWGHNSIIRILTNEKYVGDILFGKLKIANNFIAQKNATEEKGDIYLLKNHHEPIIDRDTFDKVQEKHLKKYTNIIQTKQLQKETIFTRKVFCGFCGNSFSRFHQDNKSYKLFCQTTKNGYCGSKMIRDDILEVAFVNTFNLMLNEYDNIQKKLIDNNLLYVNRILKNSESIESFDGQLFDKIIKYVIVGNKDKNVFDPYSFKFILRNNSDFFLCNGNSKLNIFEHEYYEILNFISEQYFLVFERVNDVNLTKIVDKVRISICFERDDK